MSGAACTADGSGITYNKNINVALAVAMPDGGLITPVIKEADTTDIYQVGSLPLPAQVTGTVQAHMRHVCRPVWPDHCFRSAVAWHLCPPAHPCLLCS